MLHHITPDISERLTEFSLNTQWVVNTSYIDKKCCLGNSVCPFFVDFQLAKTCMTCGCFCLWVWFALQATVIALYPDKFLLVLSRRNCLWLLCCFLHKQLYNFLSLCEMEKYLLHLTMKHAYFDLGLLLPISTTHQLSTLQRVSNQEKTPPQKRLKEQCQQTTNFL